MKSLYIQEIVLEEEMLLNKASAYLPPESYRAALSKLHVSNKSMFSS